LHPHRHALGPNRIDGENTTGVKPRPQETFRGDFSPEFLVVSLPAYQPTFTIASMASCSSLLSLLQNPPKFGGIVALLVSSERLLEAS